MKSVWGLRAAITACAFSLIAGCHSTQVDVTVKNRTGAPIRLLEVDYPNASFGADTMKAGADVHYHIQIQGSGNVKVQYTADDGRQAQSVGPKLTEHEEGKLEIDLLPDLKVEFHR